MYKFHVLTCVNDYLQELHSTCKAMQERVVDLIGKLAHDEMTAELLRINDELNNLFLRYTRYTKNKMQVPASTILAQTIAHPPNAESAPTLTKREGESLIDLSDDDNLTKRMSELGKSKLYKSNIELHIMQDCVKYYKGIFICFSRFSLYHVCMNSQD